MKFWSQTFNVVWRAKPWEKTRPEDGTLHVSFIVFWQAKTEPIVSGRNRNIKMEYEA